MIVIRRPGDSRGTIEQQGGAAIPLQPGRSNTALQSLPDALAESAQKTLRAMSELGKVGHTTVKSLYARYQQQLNEAAATRPPDFLVSLCAGIGRDGAEEVDAIAHEINNLARPSVPLCGFAPKFSNDRHAIAPELEEILKAFHCRVIVSEGRASMVIGTVNPFAVTKAVELIEATSKAKALDCPFVFPMRLSAREAGLVG